MSVQTNTCLTVENINEAFLAATPLIAQTILDLTITHPQWLDDLVAAEPFPLGNGTVMQQLIFRGQMPEIERGWDKWKNMQNNQGCAPCFGPQCGYNWSPLGGYGLERRETALMERDYRTPDYCVSQIQYTYQFEEVMAQIVRNLWRQVGFIKAWNINFNALTGLAKKYVVDSGGAKPNINNPYQYPASGTVELSNLNIELLKNFYEWLRRSPDTLPYMIQDGRPVFALACSDELIADLYRYDATLRQDIRFSGLANDNITKYNFLWTIRGMFLPAPIEFPRRFNRTAGELIEVLPYVNGIPMEVGSFTGINPAWLAAEYEEVLLHGMNPFKVFVGQQSQTLGENTSFGPEPTFLEYFKWVNPETVEDPYRRVGFWANSIKMGIHQQYSEGVFGVVVKRASVRLMWQQNPIPVCPVEEPDCDNEIDATGCPCPAVVGVQAVPSAEGQYLVTFAVSTEAVAEETLVFTLQSGGTIDGTVVEVSDDGLYALVTFEEEWNIDCNQVVSVDCGDSLVCSSAVMSASDCRSGQTGNVKLILSQPIKAVTAADVITACFGDGTTFDLDVVSVDLTNNEWIVNYATGAGPTDNPTGAGGPPATNSPLAADLICDRGGIISVCVPTATDGSCPACAACGGVSPTDDCSED